MITYRRLVQALRRGSDRAFGDILIIDTLRRNVRACRRTIRTVCGQFRAFRLRTRCRTHGRHFRTVRCRLRTFRWVAGRALRQRTARTFRHVARANRKLRTFRRVLCRARSLVTRVIAFGRELLGAVCLSHRALRWGLRRTLCQVRCTDGRGLLGAIGRRLRALGRVTGWALCQECCANGLLLLRTIRILL